MDARWFSLLSIGVIVACGRDRQENASNPDQAGDTVAMVSPTSSNGSAGTVVPEARGGSGPAASSPGLTPGTRPGSPAPAVVVQVQEEVPGLLEQARYHPLDAQHIAQGRYPRGTMQAGWLERRGKDLVYRFRIRDEDGSVHDVLVDSFRGDIINTIPVP